MTNDSRQSLLNHFTGRQHTSNAEDEDEPIESGETVVFRCNACGIMHTDEKRIDKHILNSHSSAVHDFTQNHAISRHKERMTKSK